MAIFNSYFGHNQRVPVSPGHRTPRLLRGGMTHGTFVLLTLRPRLLFLVNQNGWTSATKNGRWMGVDRIYVYIYICMTDIYIYKYIIVCVYIYISLIDIMFRHQFDGDWTNWHGAMMGRLLGRRNVISWWLHDSWGILGWFNHQYSRKNRDIMGI